MNNSDYIINELDLSDLFDLKEPPVSFRDDHTEYIPEYGSIIYTVWDSDEKFIYVGVGGGVGKRKDPSSQINQHSKMEEEVVINSVFIFKTTS